MIRKRVAVCATKPFYASKTLWLNAVALVVALLSLPELGHVVPEHWLPYIAIATALGNKVLRLLTVTGIKETHRGDSE